MTKQQTRRPLIEYKVAKPFVDAAALGLGSSAFAVVLQGPVLNWACLGAGFSLCWYWGSSNLTKPKRSKTISAASVGAGSVVVNSASGSRKVALGFNYEPRFVSRETFPEILRRFLGKLDPAPRQVIDTPPMPREFVFQSHYEGHLVELREDDVRRFLRTAWKERQRGRGLSQRRWVREWRDRPQWYKDLGPYWYKAFLILLREAQQIRKRQLVVCIGPRWFSLARDPHITLGLLREAEVMKGNVRPSPQADELIIGTDGVSSF